MRYIEEKEAYYGYLYNKDKQLTIVKNVILYKYTNLLHNYILTYFIVHDI